MIVFSIKKITLLFLFVSLYAHAFAQKAPVSYTDSGKSLTPNQIMQWHEVFIYEVRYSFFKLGEVKVEVVSDTLADKQPSWKLHTEITSNPGIPFVGEEENHYTSVFSIENGIFRVQKFWTDNVDEQEFKSSLYRFDHTNQKVYAYEKDQSPDTLALEDPASSGHFIFLASRLTAGTDSVTTLPIYLNCEKKYMTLTNTTKREKREYDAFPEKVETYYTTGDTDIDGPFGFSGAFESWYLTDDLRVPVEARVKVWLGNVKIKLKDYKKERRND